MAIFRHSTVVSHAFTGDSDIAGSALHPTRQCKRPANSANLHFHIMQHSANRGYKHEYPHVRAS